MRRATRSRGSSRPFRASTRNSMTSRKRDCCATWRHQPPQDQAPRRERRRNYADGYRSRRYAEAERSRVSPTWGMLCEHMTVALRGWPISDVERNVRLSEGQRVSFFELVAASLKTADTLASTCPADDALTPDSAVSKFCANVLPPYGRRLLPSGQPCCGSSARLTSSRRSGSRG